MDDIEIVSNALADNEKIVVAQVAPSIRVSIGEEFGYPPGTILTKKIVGALKQAGFAKVFDTSTAADLVTIEEGTELLNRIEENDHLPLFTSCCPASVLFIEKNFPHYLNHFCTIKSPQQAMGALIKTYWARKEKIKRKEIFVTSIMPCVVKKTESKRPEMEFNGVPHVDIVLTTKEIVQLLKAKGIDLKKAPEMDFDRLLGKASGAGQLYGTTGGVTEALLRFVTHQANGSASKIKFEEVRGKEVFREAKIQLGEKTLNVAVIDGLNNLKDLISNDEKFSKYHVIEIMTCPGGCIGGAGQPNSTPEKLHARKHALYDVDSAEKVKIATDNPEIKKLYKDYLIEPGSNVARSILHVKRICLNCD